MRPKFIMGNWKMCTTTAEAGRLAKAVVDGAGPGGASLDPGQFLAIIQIGLSESQAEEESA